MTNLVSQYRVVRQYNIYYLQKRVSGLFAQKETDECWETIRETNTFKAAIEWKHKYSTGEFIDI